MKSQNWVCFLKLFLKNHLKHQKNASENNKSKAQIFVWCCESFKVKKMEVVLKASLQAAEIHCMCSHITFREEGDVFHNYFIYP